MAAEVFEFNKKQLGYNFSLLDIGGGFPGTRESGELFEKMAATITSSLNRHFSAYPGVRIIAEPGNDFISIAYTNTSVNDMYLACTDPVSSCIHLTLLHVTVSMQQECCTNILPTHDNVLFTMVV